jgi:hypothetical protein
MSQRFLALIALLAFVVLVIGALLTGGNLGLADSGPTRISFQIATGSTEGVYFPVGGDVADVIQCGPAIPRPSAVRRGDIVGAHQRRHHRQSRTVDKDWWNPASPTAM